MANLGLEQLLAAAEQQLAAYLRLTSGLSHVMKGIRRSEMFFLYACLADPPPARIVESGRARAQSTLVLSCLFPDAQIVSVESDAASPDVDVAAERLKDRTNVECRFGDSRVLLPQLLQSGDAVLIDGPKDFRALKLAFRLLRTGLPRMVFVHDLWLGSPARAFVDRQVAGAILSDHPEWVRRYSHLDSTREVPDSDGGERRAYGATLGCFAAGADNYTQRLGQCMLAQTTERMRETWRKLRRRSPRARPRDFEIVS